MPSYLFQGAARRKQRRTAVRLEFGCVRVRRGGGEMERGEARAERSASIAHSAARCVKDSHERGPTIPTAAPRGQPMSSRPCRSFTHYRTDFDGRWMAQQQATRSLARQPGTT
jgi:hypothetical protein